MNKKVVGLVGLGYWGSNILRNLYELGFLHVACDENRETIEAKRKLFPDAAFTTDWNDLLKNPEVKAVAIATPAASHFQMVKQALECGKDVFVEKPLALTAFEGQHLCEFAEKNNRILMVGHILQYHPAVLKLKELIRSGELGRLQYLYSNRLNIGKLRTEENIWWSFAPHDVSVMLTLLEEEPLRVSSTGGDYLNKGICDTTLTTLDFKNGVKGHIFVSWIHPYKEQKLVVVGSKAMVVFDDLTNEKLFMYRHSIEWKNGKIPVVNKADYVVVPVESREPLKDELSHFVECVFNRTKPKTDGREGLRVLKVLESAEKNILSHHDEPATSYFKHETACVDNGAVIGEGSKIWNFSHILTGSRIGDHCIIGQNAAIGPDVSIGNRCKIQNNVSIYRGVTLEDEVFCGPSCVFTNVYTPRAFIERKNEFLPTLVKRGSTIGANATIVCGVTIGKYAMIGAGAVVKTDVKDHSIVVGVPAKHIGWACFCGKKTEKTDRGFRCESCAIDFRVDKGEFEQVQSTEKMLGDLSKATAK